MPVAKPVNAETKAWVDRRISQELAEGRNRVDLIVGLRRQRMLRLKSRLPEAYQDYLGQGVRVPISYRLVETVVGAVAGSNGPEFFLSSPDQELVHRGTTWLRLMFEAQHRISDGALYYRYWDGLIADGIIALKTVRRAWNEYPARDFEGNETDEDYNDRVEAFHRAMPPVPWRTRVVDPGTFFPPRAEWGPSYCIESGMRPSEEVFRQLGLRPTRGGNLLPLALGSDEPTVNLMRGLRMGPRVQVDELWTEGALYVRVMGKVFEYENELGKLPYLWTSGASIAFSDPTLQAMSVLYPLQYLEPWVNQFLSTLVGNATATAGDIAVITNEAIGTPGGAGEAPVVSDIPFNKMVELPPGAKMGFIAPSLDSQSVALFNTMVQLAERFTLSPIPQFAGTRTPGVVLSAVAERILAVLKPRIDQAKRTWGDQMKMYLWLVQNVVKAPVSVSGLVFEERSGRSAQATTTLTPRDVKKVSDILVDIKYRTVQDQIAWDTHNVLMMQAGIWSKERAQRESNVRDPDAESHQMAIERLQQHPAIQAYIMQQALAGHPPLEALQDLIQNASQEGGFGGAAIAGLLGQGEEQPNRPTGGRLPGEPRAPGGTGNAGAAAAVRR